MGWFLLLLLVALILGGAGFALHVLWWVALIFVVLWIASIVVGGRSRRGPP